MRIADPVGLRSGKGEGVRDVHVWGWWESGMVLFVRPSQWQAMQLASYCCLVALVGREVGMSWRHYWSGHCRRGVCLPRGASLFSLCKF